MFRRIDLPARVLGRLLLHAQIGARREETREAGRSKVQGQSLAAVQAFNR